MPSLQKLLDTVTKSGGKQNLDEKGEKRKRNCILELTSAFFRDLFIQPIKIVRAVRCLVDPENEDFQEKHNKLKVKKITKILA